MLCHPARCLYRPPTHSPPLCTLLPQQRLCHCLPPPYRMPPGLEAAKGRNRQFPSECQVPVGSKLHALAVGHKARVLQVVVGGGGGGGEQGRGEQFGVRHWVVACYRRSHRHEREREQHARPDRRPDTDTDRQTDTDKDSGTLVLTSRARHAMLVYASWSSKMSTSSCETPALCSAWFQGGGRRRGREKRV